VTDEVTVDLGNVARMMGVSEEFVRTLIALKYIRSARENGEDVVPVAELDWLLQRDRVGNG
jgi:hypothetical protein